MDNIVNKATEHGPYTYNYDSLYRLMTAEGGPLSAENYTYDAVGNRLTSVSANNWTYNPNNELQSYNGVTFQYDLNGNTIQKNDNGTVQNFLYNEDDRLTEVKDGSGAVIATYYYDPFGRRLWKEVGATKTYFMYADEGLIAEFDGAATQTKSYGYAPNSTWTTNPLFMKQDTEYYFYHNDHLGTPQKMTSVSGAVVWSAKYESFGKAVVDSGSTIDNNLRFPGQYYDAETGLHYNLNRYYHPATGRYLRTDPYGEGLNLYAYCFNNPLSLIDPWGLCTAKRVWDWWTDFWTSDPDFMIPAMYSRAVDYAATKIHQFIMGVPIESFGFNLGYGGTVKIKDKGVKFGAGIAWLVDDKKMYIIPTVEGGAGFCPGKYSVSYFFNSVIGLKAKGSDYRGPSASASGTVGPISWAASAPIRPDVFGDRVFLEIGRTFKPRGAPIEGGLGLQYGFEGYEFNNPFASTGEWWGNWLYENIHR